MLPFSARSSGVCLSHQASGCITPRRTFGCTALAVPATSPGLHANCKGRLCQCCRPGTLQYNMPLQGAIACRTHRTFLEIKLMTRALVLLPHFERTLTVTTTCLGPRCLRIAVCTSPTGLWGTLQPMGIAENLQYEMYTCAYFFCRHVRTIFTIICVQIPMVSICTSTKIHAFTRSLRTTPPSVPAGADHLPAPWQRANSKILWHIGAR